jgi:hypothetical protein
MVVEAEGSMQMTPTSMYNTYKVFHNHRMLWMRICMSPYHITTDLFCQSFGDFSRIPVTTLGRKIKHSVVVEAVDPFQMTPTSMYNTYKVFHNPHMLYMCIRMSPYHVTTDLFCQSFHDLSRILVTTLGRKIPHSVVVEAVDPFQMTPTSMYNTYKVFHNPHMLCMCIRMSHYHVTTDHFCQSFGDIPRILVTTLRRNIPHSVVVEAVDPFQMTPTSMFNTFKVFHNPHMLWIFTCMGPLPRYY